jgi:hypothetical protein
LIGAARAVSFRQNNVNSDRADFSKLLEIQT